MLACGLDAIKVLLTFVSIGRPKRCFLPVFVLAHPGQIDIKMFD